MRPSGPFTWRAQQPLWQVRGPHGPKNKGDTRVAQEYRQEEKKRWINTIPLVSSFYLWSKQAALDLKHCPVLKV